jgi:gamma-glutamyltranspeptidase/glutathione hydrolase
MVCSPDHLATQAGVAMLRDGGSAGDAAVATSAALAVTAQHSCGLGGDLFAVVVKEGERPVALNSSGRSGSGADPDALRAEGNTLMPFQHDIRSVPVPGCVDGWLELHSATGRLPLDRVLEPAIELAAGGFAASPTLARAIAGTDLPETSDLSGLDSIEPGSLIRRPGVARALRAIVASGRNGFYKGEFGERLLDLGDGEYDEADLATPLAEWQRALSADAFGHVLWTAPPNSQGYLTLAGSWIASGLDLPADPDDPMWAHLLIESSRAAAYDRVAVLSERADGDALLDPARLEPRRRAVSPERAAMLGDTYAGGGTIALCAVDSERTGVSLLQSNASGFGSLIAVPSLGFILHNRGIGFSLDRGHPAEYGPRKRPPHTLCPTALTDASGSLAAVLATMGGDSQPQILLQLLARWLVAGEAPGPALAAGRFALAPPEGWHGFSTWSEGGSVRVLLEGNCPESWPPRLAELGHEVLNLPAFGDLFGHAQLIHVLGDHLAGASDPRPRSGSAAGW